ncbi:hypothetical protein ACFE04_031361 [Oxalis oulophora]
MASKFILIAFILIATTTTVKFSSSLVLRDGRNIGSLSIMCSLTCDNSDTRYPPSASSGNGIGDAFVTLSCNGGINIINYARTDSFNGSFTIYVVDPSPVIFDQYECKIYSRTPFIGENCNAFGSTPVVIFSDLILIGFRDQYPSTGPEAIMTCNGFRVVSTEQADRHLH